MPETGQPPYDYEQASTSLDRIEKERVTAGYTAAVGDRLYPDKEALSELSPAEEKLVYAVEDAEAVQEAKDLAAGRKAAGDSLGDRMKGYEGTQRHYLMPKTPVILRVDGRAFHTYVRGTQTPFDDGLMGAMNQVAIKLCESISGAQLAYVQSDEISVLLTDYKTESTQQWFGGNIQKMVSVSAALAAVEMTLLSPQVFDPNHEADDYQAKLRPCTFDSRVFGMPKEDVVNYFIWRQQDWVRNSLQMLARSLYSHKQLMNKNSSELHEMCFQKGKNWNDLATKYKRGRCIVKRDVVSVIPAGPHAGESITRPKWTVDEEIPTFTANRGYISEHV